MTEHQFSRQGKPASDKDEQGKDKRKHSLRPENTRSEVLLKPASTSERGSWVAEGELIIIIRN